MHDLYFYNILRVTLNFDLYLYWYSKHEIGFFIDGWKQPNAAQFQPKLVLFKIIDSFNFRVSRY